MRVYRLVEHNPRGRNGRKGLKHSRETIEKIRLGNLGKKLSEKTKEKLRKSRLGFKHSVESKIKMSQNNPRYWLGKKLSKEHIENIAEGHLGIKNKIIRKRIKYPHIPLKSNLYKKKFGKLIKISHGRCEACGIKQKHLKRSLHIHHIISRRMMKVIIENSGGSRGFYVNKLKNLMLLCGKCHVYATIRYNKLFRCIFLDNLKIAKKVTINFIKRRL